MIEMNEGKLMCSKKRALSSIIGILFFLILVFGSFTAFVLMLETTSDFLGTQVDVSKKEIDKMQEEFDVLPLSLPYRDDQGATLFNHNRFNLTVDVENTGPNHVEIVDLFIINKTNSDGTQCHDASSDPCGAKIIEINYADSFIPVRSTSNILENTPITMHRGEYDLKLVTALGTKKTVPLNVGGSYFHLKMYAVPPVVHNLSNMTLLLTVTNNSSKTLYDVKPNDLFPTVFPNTAIAAQGGESKAILNDLKVIPILKPSQSGIFTFEYELKGAQGGEISFTTNATAKRNADSTEWSVFSNNATVTVRMTGQSGDDLAGAEIKQKPELFLVFPNLAGNGENDNDRGFWGAIVVNPTNQTVTIERISIQMTTPEQGGSAAQIIASGETAFDHVEPAGEGTWTVPDQNLMIWTQDDITDPLIIFPETAQEFVIKIRPTVGADITSFVVAANAHTSMGQYSTVDHTSGVTQDNTKSTILNVYPTSSVVSGTGAVGDADDLIIDAVNTIDSLETDNVFNITIREGTTKDTTQYIPGWGTVTADRGVKLIMKLPPGFPALNVVCCNQDGSDFDQDGFVIDSTSPRFVEFEDGSIQVEVKIGDDLGDFAGVERFTFQYSLDAPKIKKDQIYIYYIFANGRDFNDIPVGPVSESVVLRIVGLESECFGKQGQIILQESNGSPRACE